MPYKVEKDTSACPVSKPFAVKKTTDGSVVPGGCHENHGKALAHQRALVVNVQLKEQRAVIEGLMEQAMKPPGELTMQEKRALRKMSPPQVMEDLSFPIRNMSDLTQHAMPSFGRAGDKGKVKSWLLTRARQLGASQDVIKRIQAYST